MVGKKQWIHKFLSKVNVLDSGCWEWTMCKDTYGYGIFWIGRKTSPHRFIYEYYYGQICPDLTIDHLCRNRACCNPIHLEQVTNKVNVLRGNGVMAINSRKTHCKRGHELSENNIYRYGTSRVCKECKYITRKAWRISVGR